MIDIKIFFLILAEITRKQLDILYYVRYFILESLKSIRI